MIMPPQVESSLVGLFVNPATKGRAAAHVGSRPPHLLAYKSKPHILVSLIKRLLFDDESWAAIKGSEMMLGGVG